MRRGAERIEQHGRGVRTGDRCFGVLDGHALRQTERVRLRDVVCRPERADVALLVAEHAKQHGAYLAVGQLSVRTECAVGIAADDVVVLEIRVAERRIDVSRRPVRGVHVREDRVACIGTCIVNAHGGDGELAEFCPGQRTVRLKAIVSCALHDAERAENGGCLLK